MAEEHLHMQSHHARKTTNQRELEPNMWFYEETTGLCVVTDRSCIGYIPTRQIRAFLERLDRKVHQPKRLAREG